jgi:hypothetical protein
MECPHCSKEIPGTPCPQCQAVNPEDANYCMTCGAQMDQGVSAADAGDIFDPEERTLCPDGTCTGIIEHGRCTECGKAPGEVDSPDPA